MPTYYTGKENVDKAYGNEKSSLITRILCLQTLIYNLLVDILNNKKAYFTNFLIPKFELLATIDLDFHLKYIYSYTNQVKRSIPPTQFIHSTKSKVYPNGLFLEVLNLVLEYVGEISKMDSDSNYFKRYILYALLEIMINSNFYQTTRNSVPIITDSTFDFSQKKPTKFLSKLLVELNDKDLTNKILNPNLDKNERRDIISRHLRKQKDLFNQLYVASKYLSQINPKHTDQIITTNNNNNNNNIHQNLNNITQQVETKTNTTSFETDPIDIDMSEHRKYGLTTINTTFNHTNNIGKTNNKNGTEYCGYNNFTGFDRNPCNNFDWDHTTMSSNNSGYGNNKNQNQIHFSNSNDHSWSSQHTNNDRNNSFNVNMNYDFKPNFNIDNNTYHHKKFDYDTVMKSNNSNNNINSNTNSDYSMNVDDNTYSPISNKTFINGTVGKSNTITTNNNSNNTLINNSLFFFPEEQQVSANYYMYNGSNHQFNNFDVDSPCDSDHSIRSNENPFS